MAESVEVLDASVVDRAELRRRAYFLWAWDCAQNCERVADRIGIPSETVRYWARTDGWRVKFEQDRADLTPGESRIAIALRLQSAAIAGSEYIEAVSRGLVESPDVRDIAEKVKADGLDPTTARMLVDARVRGHDAARKARIQAAKIALDAVGFAAIRVTGNEASGAGSSASVKKPTDYRSMSASELADHERRLRLPQRSGDEE